MEARAKTPIEFTRDQEYKFEYHPLLSFDSDSQKIILDDVAKTSSKTMTTVLAQMNFSDNQQINKKIKECFLDLVKCSQSLFAYKADRQTQITYVIKFKQQWADLKELLGKDTLTLYLNEFYTISKEAAFLRIIPLAYQEIAEMDAILENFQFGDIMGHYFAYKNAQSENQFEQFVINGENGELSRSYKVIEIIVNDTSKSNETVRDQRLLGCILIPQHKDEGQQPYTVYVSWTGTCSLDTLKADFERSAGEESYRRSEDQVLKQIVDVINEFADENEQSVEIVFCGHSLGGALAQLSYHSVQRVLAANLDEKEITKLENQFREDLDKSASFKLSLHQQSLQHIHLSCNKVTGMRLIVWNSTGVLEAVEKHTNNLSPLLINSAGISQETYFGKVGGDVVDVTGQTVILRDLANNLAQSYILKLEPPTTRMATSITGLVGSVFTGAVLGSAVGFPVIGGLLLAATTASALVVTKYQAHTIQPFKNSYYPQGIFHLYASHSANGSLNTDKVSGFSKVISELGQKSVVCDIGSRVLSYCGPSASSIRFHSSKEYQDKLFIHALENVGKKSHSREELKDNMVALLATQIKTNTAGTKERVMRQIKEVDLINEKDAEGKTLLHHAIENDCFDIAESLVEIDGIDLNVQDKAGNTPMLCLMQKVNALWGSQIAYQFGLHLLEKGANLTIPNQQGKTVADIFNTWRWSGYAGSEFSRALALKLKEGSENNSSQRLTG